MKAINLHNGVLVTGENSLAYLEKIGAKRAMIITGGRSMFASGTIDRATEYLKKGGAVVSVYSGIQKNPTDDQVLKALAAAWEFRPDTFVAIGGGSPIDAAKAVMLFYEFPEISFDNVFSVTLPEKRTKTTFVAVPSTSGTASEVTHVTVITFPEKNHMKLAIKTNCLRPDVAILDGAIPMTMPANIVAETGMDALTHALESFVNKTGDDFTNALAKEAIEGILQWLPVSYAEGTLESRSKMHNYQCMAGMSFANAGLGIVHGCSHAFGGIYNLAHGLANAIILPYSMTYNQKDPYVAAQYKRLSDSIGADIIETVKNLSKTLSIPAGFQQAGIDEEVFRRDAAQLLDNAMKGSTVANPIPVSREDMTRFINCVYYGKPVTF